MNPDTGTPTEGPGATSPRATLVDLLAIAVPPAVWFVHLNVSYVLVPPSCRAGHRWFLLAATLVALAAMAPSARRSASARNTEDRQGLESFLGAFGLWFTLFFALITLLVGVSALLVGPCR